MTSTTVTVTDLQEGNTPDVIMLDVPNDDNMKVSAILTEVLCVYMTEDKVDTLFTDGHIRLGDYIVCHYDHTTPLPDTERNKAYEAAMTIHSIYLNPPQPATEPALDTIEMERAVLTARMLVGIEINSK